MATRQQVGEFLPMLRSRKLQLLRDGITYAQQMDADCYGWSGMSKAEHINRAKEKFEQFRDDIKYNLDEYADYELLNFIRLEAVECYEQAQDFEHNLHIKWRRLRTAIQALNILKAEKPELSIYSNRYLCSRQQIRLNN